MAGTGTAHMRAGDPILRVEHLVVEFKAGRGSTVHAVSDVSLDLFPRETLGLVGESGCGKSSLARALVQLPPPTSGAVRVEGTDLTALKGRALREHRRSIQIIFQDPISSLNPRRRVFDIVAEPLRVWRECSPPEVDERVRRALTAVGLDPEASRSTRPHQLSGGMCQRVCIARALVLDPKVVVCDEPVSALDVSVQAQILNLLEDLRERFGIALVFISHDLAVVKNVSDRIAVMYLGKLCEVAEPVSLYTRPAHPYTSLLLDAIPVPDPALNQARQRISGELPSPLSPPSGCRFRTRCPRADQRCASEEPLLRPLRGGHFVACHHPLWEGGDATPLAAQNSTSVST